MFVVAMTLAVLGSVGVYALAAASNEVRTSGNERQNTQTHYLSEYGVIGITHEMVASKAQFYLGLMLSNAGHPVRVACPASRPRRARSRARAAASGRSSSGSPGSPVRSPSPTRATRPTRRASRRESFGPVPMNGDFFVELTEPTQAQAPARYSTDLHFCFIEMTATSNGITQPVVPGQPTGVYANEGIEMQRARIMAGPVQCPR